MKFQWLPSTLLLVSPQCKFSLQLYEDTAIREIITIDPDTTYQNGAECCIKNSIPKIDLIDTEIRQIEGAAPTNSKYYLHSPHWNNTDRAITWTTSKYVN